MAKKKYLAYKSPYQELYDSPFEKIWIRHFDKCVDMHISIFKNKSSTRLVEDKYPDYEFNFRSFGQANETVTRNQVLPPFTCLKDYDIYCEAKEKYLKTLKF